MAHALIVDDDELFCFALSGILTNAGHRTQVAPCLEAAFALAVKDDPDLVFLDVRLPDGNGLDNISRFRALPSSPEIIIITGTGDPDGAELAIRNGAWDYIEKTDSHQVLRLSFLRALEYRNKKLAVLPVKREGIIGDSPALLYCIDQVRQAARSSASVLLQGETGTGKELFAQALHSNGSNPHKPFVVVDCASLHETIVGSELFGYKRGAFTGAVKDTTGLVQRAHGGTLFLDEISELAPALQKSFLRVLETHLFRPLGADREDKSEFRLVCASNRDLDNLVSQKKFREDLLYRIRAIAIHLPPLRERTGDIEALSRYHLDKICRNYKIPRKILSPELIDLFAGYAWPGNVRELVNTLEVLTASAQQERILFPSHLPQELHARLLRHPGHNYGTPFLKNEPGTDADADMRWKEFRKKALDTVERRYLIRLMQHAHNDIPTAITLSGMSQARLYGLLKKHDLGRR